MKRFLNLIWVFTSILSVNSMVEVMNTIPQKNYFPALLLQGKLMFKRPAVPREIIDTMFTFEKFDMAISYQCPARANTLELERSYGISCANKLTVISSPNGNTCGNKNRLEYDVGYGSKIRHHTFHPNKQEEIVEYPLYVSCYDKSDKKVYHVEYELRHRNKLYEKSSEIYPEQQLKEIAKYHSEFRKEMAKKFDELHQAQKEPPKIKVSQHLRDFEKSGEKTGGRGYLIPFQLVSHEDMILYNLKMASFNEMNYSLIWSNIADNAWKKLNVFMRHTMIRSNDNVEVHTGVHDYTKQGYPRYLWKFLRANLKGIVVVIHNHPPDDEETYDPLCYEHSCEAHSFYVNEKNKNLGYTYCCETKELKEKIPFFKRNFWEIQPLAIGDLFTDDEGRDVSLPPSPPSTVAVRAPEKTSSVPTIPNFRPGAAPYDPAKRFRRRPPTQPERTEGTQESGKLSDKHVEDDDATKEMKRRIEEYKSSPQSADKQSVNAAVDNEAIEAMKKKLDNFKLGKPGK